MNTLAKSAALKKTPPAKPASVKKAPPAKLTVPKKTPPSRKFTVKTPPNPPPEPETESSTPKTTDTKAASASKAKLVKTDDTTPISAADSVPEQPSRVEQEKASADAVEVTPETKVATRVKKTRTVVGKVLVRTKTPTSVKAVTRQTPKPEGTEKLKGKESSEKEQVGDAKDVDSEKKEESSVSNVEESAKMEEPAVENVEATKTEEDQSVMNVEEPTKQEEKAVDVEQPLVPNVGKSTTQEDPVAVDVAESLESREPVMAREEAEVKEKKEEMRIVEDKVGPNNELVSMEEDTNKELKGQDAEPVDGYQGAERMEECRDQEVLEEFEALEEECLEFTAVAKERKIRKEVEIFVGGLDRDAVEEDVKKAFENIGEVVEVRLNKDPSTNKNKGYAFVKFATKEQASRALSEMKNPLIRGKQCGTAPNEDNDTLFLGNICNTWTKEAIKQKLKDYGIEGVENITLVSDVWHEGLSRGFAFIEFS
ncbi:unnamed protein product [Camellia sinensis]